jgi:hypothetical protein
MKKTRKNKNRNRQKRKDRSRIRRLGRSTRRHHPAMGGCPWCAPMGPEEAKAMTPTQENIERWIADWDRMRRKSGHDMGEIVSLELVMSERDRKLQGTTPVSREEFIASVKKLTRPAILHVKTDRALLGFPIGAPDMGAVFRAFEQDEAEKDFDYEEAS